jgi:hypothetical protein
MKQNHKRIIKLERRINTLTRLRKWCNNQIQSCKKELKTLKLLEGLT